MSSKEKLALGTTVAVAVGVAAYAYTQSRRVYSHDKDTTKKEKRIEEENYTATDEAIMVTHEDPSKDEKLDDASKKEQDEAMESSDGELKQDSSKSKEEIRTVDSSNGKED